MSAEFINNKVRYCIWLDKVSPDVIKKSKELYKRVSAVKEFRLNSSAAPTREKAEIPHRFFFVAQTDDNYLLIPRVSSENRRYIPIGFMSPEIIASDACSIVPGAELYHLGVLCSNIHNAWVTLMPLP